MRTQSNLQTFFGRSQAAVEKPCETLSEDRQEMNPRHQAVRFVHALAIRYFGLLAPGTKSRLWTALFFLLGQEMRPRPKRLSWRNSLRQCFGVDPLVDRTGEPMKWVRRQKPAVSGLVA
jgi:hypothetical protein